MVLKNDLFCLKKKPKTDDEYCTLVKPPPDEIEVKEGEDIKICCNIIGMMALYN